MNLTITEPGKFEGEPRWVPYFWGLVFDGEGEECHDGSVILLVEPGDVVIYPELEGVSHVQLCEDEAGFVYGVVVD